MSGFPGPGPLSTIRSFGVLTSRKMAGNAIQSDAGYFGDSAVEGGSADGPDETQRRGCFGVSGRAS